MSTPKIGQSVYEKTEEPVTYDMTDLSVENDLGIVAQPPRCVVEDLKRLDHVWRWVARPTVKFMGMRQYTTYSVRPEIKKRIDAGDCPSGVFVDVENKLCWREDAWLASIPRKQHEWRVAQKRKLTEKQTELAFKIQQQSLREAMLRKGADLKVSFEQKLAVEDE